MTAINSIAATFTTSSFSQLNRSTQTNNALDAAIAPTTGDAFHNQIDSTSTGIRIDNKTLSTFPIDDGAPNPISQLLHAVVSSTSKFSPITAQSTSPNPKVSTLMSPTPEGSLATFARVYA